MKSSLNKPLYPWKIKYGCAQGYPPPAILIWSIGFRLGRPTLVGS